MVKAFCYCTKMVIKLRLKQASALSVEPVLALKMATYMPHPIRKYSVLN